jgi:hypothetical protein
MTPYKTVAAQALHYFSRPHAGLPSGPVRGPSAWTRDRFGADDAWVRPLTPAQIADLDATVARGRAARIPLARLTAAACPMPAIAAAAAAWRRELLDGVGFVVLRGFPVERYAPEDAELAYWALGLHLGTPGAQDAAGRLLTHVRDEGAPPDDATRLYRSSGRIEYHCDAADVVGLLCLQNAASGGRSRIASSVTVLNRLAVEDPAAHRALFRPVLLDARGENGIDYLAIPPARFDGARLRTFYHADYFRSARRHPGAAARVDAYAAALDRFEAIAHAPDVCLEMDLRPGDVQLLSNHTIVHARTAYADAGERRRHLLRLWISAEPPGGLRDRARRLASRAGLLASLAAARLRGRLSGPAAR